MKQLLLLLVQLLLLSVSTDSLHAQDSTKTQIGSICAAVTAINAAGAGYRVEEDDSSDVSSEGSAIKKYYAGTTLRKVSFEAFGAVGNMKAELYFAAGKLIFCYEVTKLYGGLISDPQRPLISEERTCYYLHGGRLFCCINRQGHKLNGEALLEKERYLMQLKQELQL